MNVSTERWMNMIKWLRDIRKTDAPIVGGKAANLGELMYMGFNVPEGFILTEKSDLEHIKDWLERIGDGKVAVRSSSIAEDGDKFSFAGMYDSFLNIEARDEDRVGHFILEVFNSLESTRATEYRDECNVDTDKMAVIIQRQVDAVYSGVMFTRDPVTDDDTIVCMEICEGLGDDLVAGKITPDAYVVRKESLRILETPDDPNMPQEGVQTLAVLANDIESSYGKPQDIEFSIDNRDIWVVQSRPIIF